MGYDDEPGGNAERVGQAIYKDALEDRRGFRPDQIGISRDDTVWGEIFESIGLAALEAMSGAGMTD